MSDDVVWQLVKNGFCSYRKDTDAKPFCTNAYNVTGLCNKASCPLANSNYATVIEDQGSIYLCCKTAERCHLPRQQWERIKLSKNLKEALEQISEETKVGFPNHLTLKCKLRFRKWRQVLARTRRMELNKKVKIVPIKTKTDRRERLRERKAEIAAKLDRSIEAELLKRLNQGVYGELYHFETDEDIQRQEIELVEREYETERVQPQLKAKPPVRKRIEIEYETIEESQQLRQLQRR